MASRSLQFFLLPLLRFLFLQRHKHLFTYLHQFNNSFNQYSTTVPVPKYTSSKWARTRSFLKVRVSSFPFPATSSSRLPRRLLKRIGIVKLEIMDECFCIDGHTFLEGTASCCQTSSAHPYTIGIIGASTTYPTSLSR